MSPEETDTPPEVDEGGGGAEVTIHVTDVDEQTVTAGRVLNSNSDEDVADALILCLRGIVGMRTGLAGALWQRGVQL